MRSRKRLPPDILLVAREHLGQAEPCAVFDMLFDASLRAVRGVSRDDPRLNEALNKALDRIYAELTGRVTTDTAQVPVMQANKLAGMKMPRPALRP